MPAETLALLLGRWSVTREIDDHRTGEHARFDGTATIEEARAGSDLVATYDEAGELVVADRRTPATRRLGYGARGDGSLDVRFADGRHFVDLDLRSGAWEAHHPCAPDAYLVETRVLSPTSFEERWTVRGPAKSYDALTTYERVAGHPATK
ncbi:hypothetical protein ASL10_14010 [Frigoribacterium sp. Leaf8]|uniref:DUF6314 family protein n=1 Tax=Frigoribacterium sp. Leaf8 TaxID=1735673 RepID=UPI0006F2FB41|nr:DUF6314 family protein [Frigoribacterium sp. Leaf8]KQM24361.1 hypothetical protein ASL10_14010 [Frigoribacterium sp. Leaf8]